MEVTTLISKENAQLNRDLLNLLDRALEQHENARALVISGDKKQALRLIQIEREIFAEYVNIEAEIAFNVTKAPVDKNLRRIIAYFAISRELSHIARYANQMAKFVIALEDKPAKSSVRRITAVQELFLTSLREVRAVIAEENPRAALELASKDIAIDDLSTRVRRELIASISEKKDAHEVNERMFVQNIVNALERAGDTIVRICEYIIYIETGSHTRL